MKLKNAYTFALCLLLGVLAASPLAAQNDDDEWMPQVIRNPKSAYMGYRVEQGDTVYYDSIDPCWIFPRGYKALATAYTLAVMSSTFCRFQF